MLGKQSMLTETARVVAVESGAVWLETIRQSSCGQCALQKGCGQSLLQSMFNGSRHHMRLSTQDLDFQPKLYDQLLIGIPNVAVLQGSLILYLLPVLAMLAGMFVATQAQWHEGLVLLAGASAMLICMLLIRLLSAIPIVKQAIEPVILRAISLPAAAVLIKQE